MQEALTNLVWERASHRCEYCQLPQQYSSTPFEIDHIVAQQQGGKTKASNLGSRLFRLQSSQGTKSGWNRSQVRKESLAIQSSPA